MILGYAGELPFPSTTPQKVWHVTFNDSLSVTQCLFDERSLSQLQQTHFNNPQRVFYTYFLHIETMTSEVRRNSSIAQHAKLAWLRGLKELRIDHTANALYLVI